MDSEAELSLVIRAKNLASKEVDKLRASMIRLRGGVTAVGGALKTLLKVGILGLITAGVAVVGTLLGSAKAAADEQVGINRLNAALKANVKGHTAQKKAIESVISQREALAFSDDDLRNSLTTLVTKYGNVARAEKIQRVAMDVARLKGISLADATNLVSKGMDGNAKILKQLGIQVDKHATKQEILTAIQKKAAGQAEKYGKSAQGAQEAFGIALQDVVEDIGNGLMPVMTAAFTWLRTDAIPAIRAAGGAIGRWIDQNKPLIDNLKKIAGTIVDRLKPVLHNIANFVTNTLIPAISAFVTWLWGDGKGPLPTAVNFLSDVFNNVLIPAFKAVMGVLNTLIGVLQTAVGWFQKLVDANQTWRATGVTHFDAPKGNRIFGKPGARGGMRGVHGPEMILVGEQGPEMVIPHTQSMAAQGVTITGVSEREIMDIVDRGLYVRLQRAGTGR